MNRAILHQTAVCAMILLSAGCADWKFTRVEPGETVEIALAKKATAVATPAPVGAAPVGGVPPPCIPEVDELLTLGNFCLETQRDAEAVNAFEKAVKLDPSRAEGWSGLITACQNTGRQKRADEAVQKLKALLAH
jgi:tetratricopeptide (TPR) repeat protein